MPEGYDNIYEFIQPSKKRKHATINIKEIIDCGLLDENTATSGLKWLEKEAGIFALNDNIFADFYREKCNSNASWSSIKSLLNPTKSGFKCLRKLCPSGYNSVYSYTACDSEPNELLPRHSDSTGASHS